MCHANNHENITLNAANSVILCPFYYLLLFCSDYYNTYNMFVKFLLGVKNVCFFALFLDRGRKNLLSFMC